MTAGYPARLRRLALSFPESREDHPFGPDIHVFKVGGGSRMFAIMGEGHPVRITLKLSKEEREIALTLPYVSEAKYVGRYGWITSQVDDDDAMQATLEWLRESYWMRAPEALRESAWK